MPTSALLPHGTREERAQRLEQALRAFQRKYGVPPGAMVRLSDALYFVPPEVHRNEIRLLSGAQREELTNDGREALDEYISRNRKALGKAKARAWRMQLKRRGWLTTAKQGRQPYEYERLERMYALAILDALPGRERFPISRQNERFGGPAMRLLSAALAHALPASGPGSDSAREHRLRNLRRRGKNIEVVR